VLGDRCFLDTSMSESISEEGANYEDIGEDISEKEEEETPAFKTEVEYSLSSSASVDEILTHSSSTDDEKHDCSRLPETEDHYCRFNDRRKEQFGNDKTPQTLSGEERHYTMFYSRRQAEFALMKQKRNRIFFNKKKELIIFLLMNLNYSSQ